MTVKAVVFSQLRITWYLVIRGPINHLNSKNCYFTTEERRFILTCNADHTHGSFVLAEILQMFIIKSN